MRRFAVLTASWMCLLVACGAAEAAGSSPRVEGVLQEAAQTGRLVLAVAGYADCDACRSFKQKLAAQPLLAQFTVLELTMNGDGWREWKSWQDMTNTDQKSSPQVFVIRADGRVLHDGAVPQDLAGFLRGQLDQGGLPLSADQAVHFDAALAKAKRLAAAGDRAEALRTLAPALKVQSFAAPARASREFREQMAADIKVSVEEATKHVADSAEGVEAAVTLVEASRSFSKSLPEAAKAAVVAMTTLKKQPDLRTVLQQAEQLQQADAAARQSAAKGADKYRKVVEQYAGSAAAAVAQSRLVKLDAE